MGLNIEDENLGAFSPPELEQFTVKIIDVRILIFSLGEIEFPNIGSREIFTFGYCYPFRYEDGGMISVYNPTAWIGAKSQRFETKELLFRAFKSLKSKTIQKNPDILLIWDGKIMRDMSYGIK